MALTFPPPHVESTLSQLPPTWNPNPHLLPLDHSAFRICPEIGLLSDPWVGGGETFRYCSAGGYRWIYLAILCRIALHPIYILESDFPADNVALFRSVCTQPKMQLVRVYTQKCNRDFVTDETCQYNSLQTPDQSFSMSNYFPVL